jgi:serine/threonine protein kinase
MQAEHDGMWRRIEDLFGRALELPPGERAAFLDGACEGDVSLRREVEALLASHQRAGDFIQSPAFEDGLKVITQPESPLAEGHRIGPYQVIRELGRGGMGAVYLAARADDEYKKQVAIKIVKRGMDSEEVLDRFRNERQILASLDHPNIARLFDGGATKDGLPFFVMEYVEGLPVDEYCDGQKLSTVERLKLYRKVCAAVHHAHGNLVVHRDIKPSNILVMTDGTPKLLDFGIAKLLDQDAAVSGQRTATVARIMTPQYASPEQVRGGAITTASDIYSLGVLLYKLLTGRLPYQFKTLLPAEIEKVICERETERPSTAITRTGGAADGAEERVAPATPESLAEARREKPEGLRRKLKGDLDNIVLMAMRKEPQRRYSSVEQLSGDIRRHLEGLPVIAANDTFRYRTSKFVRRHRIGMAAAALVLLSLLAGIAATTWQARLARREKANAERINAFLEQIINYSNPVMESSRSNGHATTIEDALDLAAQRVESGEFADQPEVEVELLRMIAHSYLFQGRYDLAIKYGGEYLATQDGRDGQDAPRAVEASAMRAVLAFIKGDITEAETLYRRLLPVMRNQYQKGSLKPEALAEAVNNFAYLRRTQGDSKEAESLFRETLALTPQIQAESQYIVRLTRTTLASTIADQGRFEDALEVSRQAVDEFRQTGQADTPDFGFSLTVMGGFLTDKADFAGADRALREAEAILRQRLKPGHLWLGDNLRNQAISLYRQDRFQEAQDRVAEALKIYQGFGPHYDQYPTLLIVQGLILDKTGRSREGEAILREALRLRTQTLPKGHYWIAVAQGALGECLARQKRFDEAEPLLVESYAVLDSSLGQRDPRTNEAKQRLRGLYQVWGKPEQAAQIGLPHQP